MPRTVSRFLAGFAALAAAALLGGCSSGLKDQSGLRSEPRVAELPKASAPAIVPSRRCANYFLIDATINGRGPYALLLDTGASQTVVATRVLRDLAADTRPVEGTAIGSQGRRQTIDGVLAIRTLSAGPLELRDFTAIGLDLSTVESALGARVDGILGYQSFADLLLTIDYPASAITIQRGELPPVNGSSVVALTNADRPEVTVKIGDARRTMLIDSGKGGAFSMRNLDRLDMLTPPTEITTGVAVGGTYVRKSARLADDIVLGPAVFKTPIVDASDASNLIGAAAFTEMALTFDQRNRRLRITPRADVAVTFPPIRGIGAGFDFTGGAWKISHVFPNSPAEAVGLLPGDILIRFNGRRLRELACTPPGWMFATGDSVKVDVVRPPRQRLTFEVPIAIVVP